MYESFGEFYPYLKGEKFSNGLRVELDHQKMEYRIDLLKKLSAGKKVIHIGFADHPPLIPQKIANNVWLHNHLREAAARCVGVDINCSAVRFVQETYKIDDIFCVDITEEIPKELANEHWNMVILPEVLEHTNNPVLFLQKLQKNLYSLTDTLVVSVPNAFRYNNIIYSRQNCEAINSDHRYWFTPYTLLKILVIAGFEIECLWLCEAFKPKLKGRLRHILKYFQLERVPLLRDTIVAMAKFKISGG